MMLMNKTSRLNISPLVPCLLIRSFTSSHSTNDLHISKRTSVKPHHIAVIGGGITGLATTYYAAKRYPEAKVTLFEASNRLGGVIDSTTVTIPNGTSAVCEMGPRTLRANAPRAIMMIELIHQLGLEKDLIVIPKSDPIASMRYIWFPDHLVTIPVANALKSIAYMPAPDKLKARRLWMLLRVLWTEPLFKGLFVGLLRSIFKKRPKHATNDDSVYNLLERRFGKRVTDNLCSAIIHGLFAGDMRKLSARALLPGLWEIENRLSAPNGMYNLFSNRKSKVSAEPWAKNEAKMLQDLRLGELKEFERNKFKDVSVFNFRGGVGHLTSTITAAVRRMDNVSIKPESKIASIRENGRKVSLQISESHRHSETRDFSHIISTISLPVTLNLFFPHHGFRTITHVPVMTITLCYSTPNLTHPRRGFGYLLPFSLAQNQNPECALGVVFDSDAIPTLDTFTGTKISVMLGGRYWTSRSSLPTTDDGIEMAKSLLRRQLGITEKPVAVATRLEREAIPQYGVGHFDMLRNVHGMLSRFGGRVRVAGNSYHGISVHDCLYSARRVVEELDDEGRTGLEWCE